MTRGNALVGDLEVREALVVAQPHVERRLVALDQVRFEDQRLDLVGDDDRAHVGDALDHLRRCGTGARRESWKYERTRLRSETALPMYRMRPSAPIIM